MAGDLDKRLGFVFDGEQQLKDAGLVAADAAAQVGGTNKVVDIGDGIFHGVVMINATAVEIADNDELYEIYLQGSTSATFASTIVNLAMYPLGALEAMAANADQDVGVGIHYLPFINMQDNTVYRYVRLFTDVTGTVGTGINFEAFVGRTGRVI